MNVGYKQDPPLLFQIEHDPFEQYPIDNTTTEYKQVRAAIDQARALHNATLLPVVNQNALGQNPDVQVCCDPESQKKYPQFPNCTATN